jgi:hypothetical protein
MLGNKQYSATRGQHDREPSSAGQPYQKLIPSQWRFSESGVQIARPQLEHAAQYQM